jgi:hypothetical protein
MATVASLTWTVPPEALARSVGDYGKRLLAAALALAQVFAARIEAQAKATAGWTDRTGNARQGLTARAIGSATGVVIILFHTCITASSSSSRTRDGSP